MIGDDRSGAGATVRISIDLSIERSSAFDQIVEELAFSLSRSGIQFEEGPEGRVVENGFEVGRVISWEPPERILLRWHPAEWEPGEETEVELRLDPLKGGTRVVLEHYSWGRLLGSEEERAGWFADQLAGPLLKATSPGAFGDWFTDRYARRPSGTQSRAVYRDPLYHYPNFGVILEELDLKPDDYLLEVGCGGGAMLKEALRSGCRAAAIDHSVEMVDLARRENADAVAEGRLEVRHASAERLPFDDASFTCAAMTGVLGFLRDPVAALAEIYRVLAPGGRLVVLGSDPELRGTPGAPEPMASRLRFYEDDELARLGRDAGFGNARSIRRNLEPHARRAGVPEEHVPLFSGTTRFLVARKD